MESVCYEEIPINQVSPIPERDSKSFYKKNFLKTIYGGECDLKLVGPMEMLFTAKWNLPKALKTC